jgi:hypothetical protein
VVDRRATWGSGGPPAAFCAATEDALVAPARGGATVRARETTASAGAGAAAEPRRCHQRRTVGAGADVAAGAVPAAPAPAPVDEADDPAPAVALLPPSSEAGLCAPPCRATCSRALSTCALGTCAPDAEADGVLEAAAGTAAD